MKFANVTYGSTPKDTKTYTYVVNDNVRKGDKLISIVKHYQSGKVFATTSVAASTSKFISPEEAREMAAKGVTPTEMGSSYTGKELGIEKTIQGKGGKFVVGGKSTHDEQGNYIVGAREEAARGEALLLAERQGAKLAETAKTTSAIERADRYNSATGNKPQQPPMPSGSFEEYSKKFKEQ